MKRLIAAALLLAAVPAGAQVPIPMVQGQVQSPACTGQCVAYRELLIEANDRLARLDAARQQQAAELEALKAERDAARKAAGPKATE